MIPQQKIQDICKRLLTKSQANRVNWLQRGEQRYGVKLPAGGVEIGFNSPQMEADEIRISVTSPDGRIVGQWTVSQDEEDLWPLYFGLYQDAERCVTGWDQVLNGIEAAIGSEGPIGIVDASNLPTNDVPF